MTPKGASSMMTRATPLTASAASARNCLVPASLLRRNRPNSTPQNSSDRYFASWMASRGLQTNSSTKTSSRSRPLFGNPLKLAGASARWPIPTRCRLNTSIDRNEAAAVLTANMIRVLLRPYTFLLSSPVDAIALRMTTNTRSGAKCLTVLRNRAPTSESQ